MIVSKKGDTVLTVAKIREGINTVANEYPIKRVDLFGSCANGTNHEKSDVDLLVEFFTASISLLTLNALKYRLEEIYNIEVDVIHAPLDDDAMIKIGEVIPLYGS